MEKINTWLLFTMLATTMWGLWAFLPKITVGIISPKSALVYEVLGSMAVGIIALAIVGTELELKPVGAILGIATGVAGMLGALFFLYALRSGSGPVTIAITSLYPLIAIILSVALLHEGLTAKQAAGVVLAFFAIVLLSIE
jgi:bacterial/archaeal transporter family protein